MLNEDLQLLLVGQRTRLCLKVNAKAKSSGLTGIQAGALKVSVTDPPEKGKANRAVLTLLGKALGLPKSSLVITVGETSPDKVVLIPLPPDEVRTKLRRSIR